MNQVIGGEFEIDIKNDFNSYSKLPREFSQGQFYSSGRAALYHILNFSKQLGKDKILLPEYLCESIVEIAKLTSIPFEFYKVTQDLTIDIDSLFKIYKTESSILIINYFGGIDIRSEIQKIKAINSNAFVILDNVQSFYSMFESFDVDFMFTSFRKQLPVPDGAWVVSKHDGLFRCEKENSFAQYKLAGGLLKNYQRFDSVPEQLYLELFEKGESAISVNLNAKISDVTLDILGRLDFKLIRQKRVENSIFIIDGLKKLDLIPIVNFRSDVVPLFVPITLKKRDSIRQALRKNNIFCPVHWPKLSEIENRNCTLYDEELSLVIDHRYCKENLSRMLNVIEESLNNAK